MAFIDDIKEVVYSDEITPEGLIETLDITEKELVSLATYLAQAQRRGGYSLIDPRGFLLMVFAVGFEMGRRNTSKI
jgi:hypothetical protein